jgi:hypothetical protein
MYLLVSNLISIGSQHSNNFSFPAIPKQSAEMHFMFQNASPNYQAQAGH